jgi:hypothetical protein
MRRSFLGAPKPEKRVEINETIETAGFPVGAANVRELALAYAQKFSWCAKLVF